MDQWLQIFGALMVLAAFVAVQLRFLAQDSYPSLLLNLVGSVILAVLAYLAQQWGFLLLEVVWGLVSLWSLQLRVRKGPAASG